MPSLFILHEQKRPDLKLMVKSADKENRKIGETLLLSLRQFRHKICLVKTECQKTDTGS